MIETIALSVVVNLVVLALVSPTMRKELLTYFDLFSKQRNSLNKAE